MDNLKTLEVLNGSQITANDETARFLCCHKRPQFVTAVSTTSEIGAHSNKNLLLTRPTHREPLNHRTWHTPKGVTPR
eukprot:8077990-Pyramimonas_sp.AAC.1